MGALGLQAYGIWWATLQFKPKSKLKPELKSKLKPKLQSKLKTKLKPKPMSHGIACS